MASGATVDTRPIQRHYKVSRIHYLVFPAVASGPMDDMRVRITVGESRPPRAVVHVHDVAVSVIHDDAVEAAIQLSRVQIWRA